MSFNLAPYRNLSKQWNSFGSNYQPERAFYKNVPICRLEDVKDILKKDGRKFRIRYRGSRSNLYDNRAKHRRNQDCLKMFADRFSVYFI